MTQGEAKKGKRKKKSVGMIHVKACSEKNGTKFLSQHNFPGIFKFLD